MLPEACGAYQKSARVGHSAIIAVPVRAAATSEPTMPTMRSTGSMERFTGCPPRMIWRALGRLAWLARLSARNAPYRRTKVAMAKSAKTPHSIRHVVQKTSRVAERSEPEQVHPVREGGLGREENCGDDDRERQSTCAPAADCAAPAAPDVPAESQSNLAYFYPALFVPLAATRIVQGRHEADCIPLHIFKGPGWNTIESGERHGLRERSGRRTQQERETESATG